MRDMTRQARKDKGAARKAQKVARACKSPRGHRPIREIAWQ